MDVINSNRAVNKLSFNIIDKCSNVEIGCKFSCLACVAIVQGLYTPVFSHVLV